VVLVKWGEDRVGKEVWVVEGRHGDGFLSKVCVLVVCMLCRYEHVIDVSPMKWQ
jgi:hypothetical protein